MAHVILIQSLRRGLVLLRRVLRAKKYYDKTKAVINASEVLLFAGDESHSTVIGEDVYLYILGHNAFSFMDPKRQISEQDVQALLADALLRYREEKVSSDAQSCIIEFAYQLGRVTQAHNPDTVDNILRHFKSEVFITKDPFVDYISVPKIDLTPTLRTLLGLYLITPNEWVGICKTIAQPDFIEQIQSPANELSNSTVHRISTFESLVLRGAYSAVLPEQSYIQFTKGDSALGLSLPSLYPSKPRFTGREALPLDRSITAQMVDATSQRTMARKGYVRTLDGVWAHVNDVEDGVKVVAGKEVTGKVLRVNISAEQQRNPFDDALRIKKGIEALRDLAKGLSPKK